MGGKGPMGNIGRNAGIGLAAPASAALLYALYNMMQGNGGTTPPPNQATPPAVGSIPGTGGPTGTPRGMPPGLPPAPPEGNV